MNTVMLREHYYMFSLLCKSPRDTNSFSVRSLSLSIKSNNGHEVGNFLLYNTPTNWKRNILLLFLHITRNAHANHAPGTLLSCLIISRNELCQIYQLITNGDCFANQIKLADADGSNQETKQTQKSNPRPIYVFKYSKYCFNRNNIKHNQRNAI